MSGTRTTAPVRSPGQEPTQTRLMREHGYVTLPGLLDPAQLAGLRAAACALHTRAAELEASEGDFVLEAEGGGWVAWQQGDAPIRGLLRSVSNAHHHAPRLTELERELDLPGGLVPQLTGGDPGTLATSFLWAKPALRGSEKPWHQDLAFAPPGFDLRAHDVVTLWIAVDPATEENGCLQFVPGSHRHGLFPHTGHAERGPDEAPLTGAVEPHVIPEQVLPGCRAVAVPLEPGSAVAFGGLTLHRSAPNTTAHRPRTAISFVYRVPAGPAPEDRS